MVYYGGVLELLQGEKEALMTEISYFSEVPLCDH